MKVLVVGGPGFDEYGFLKGMLQTLFAFEDNELDPDVEFFGLPETDVARVLDRYLANRPSGPYRKRQVQSTAHGMDVHQILKGMDHLIVLGTAPPFVMKLVEEAFHLNLEVHRFTSAERRPDRTKVPHDFPQDDARYFNQDYRRQQEMSQMKMAEVQYQQMRAAQDRMGRALAQKVDRDLFTFPKGNSFR